MVCTVDLKQYDITTTPTLYIIHNTYNKIHVILKRYIFL